MFRLTGFLTGAALAAAALLLMTQPAKREQASALAAEESAAEEPIPMVSAETEPTETQEPKAGAGRRDSSIPADIDTAREDDVRWQPVWQAFRSELSARGFAGHLEYLTGQQYRVRRIAPWSYQVELAYTDERQRDAVLGQIQASTGLGLAAERP